MKNMMVNLTPTMALLAVVAYLCWPYLDGGSGLKLDMGGKQLSRIDKDRLIPNLPDPSTRNPFEPVVEPEVAPQETAAIVRAPSGSLLPSPPEEPPVDIAAVVRSFNLTGTLLGERNCAVIDGQLRFEGDELPVKSGHSIRCTLHEVTHNKVVVRVEGEDHGLDYQAPQKRKEGGTSPSNQPASQPGPAIAAPQREIPGEEILSGLTDQQASKGNVYESIQRALTAAVANAEREASPEESKPRP